MIIKTISDTLRNQIVNRMIWMGGGSKLVLQSKSLNCQLESTLEIENLHRALNFVETVKFRATIRMMRRCSR